jgi:hypothetical protein
MRRKPKATDLDCVCTGLLCLVLSGVAKFGAPSGSVAVRAS